MNAEHVEAARRLAKETWDTAPVGTTYRDGLVRVVDALDAAGVLRTGLEREAIAACEALEDARKRRDSRLGDAELSPRQQRCLNKACAMGEASLALKQPPKPRWTMERTAPSGGCAPDRFGWRFIQRPGDRYVVLNYATEAEADILHAALNATEATS